MANATETTLINQLRTVLDLTHTEIQVAETRIAQARTEAVQKELTQNANNGRIRAVAIEKASGGARRGVLGRLAISAGNQFSATARSAVLSEVGGGADTAISGSKNGERNSSPAAGCSGWIRRPVDSGGRRR